MFETKEDWSVELGRTKGNCKVSSANEDYVISEKWVLITVFGMLLLLDDASLFISQTKWVEVAFEYVCLKCLIEVCKIWKGVAKLTLSNHLSTA